MSVITVPSLDLFGNPIHDDPPPVKPITAPPPAKPSPVFTYKHEPRPRPYETCREGNVTTIWYTDNP